MPGFIKLAKPFRQVDRFDAASSKREYPDSFYSVFLINCHGFQILKTIESEISDILYISFNDNLLYFKTYSFKVRLDITLVIIIFPVNIINTVNPRVFMQSYKKLAVFIYCIKRVAISFVIWHWKILVRFMEKLFMPIPSKRAEIKS